MSLLSRLRALLSRRPVVVHNHVYLNGKEIARAVGRGRGDDAAARR